jgi:Family of unknown function (DUF5335)
MSTRLTIPQSEWKPFFDRLSHALVGKRAEIEVASLELGDQIAAEWVPMLGVTYEIRDDVLDVDLDRVGHRIQHPRQIMVEQNGDVITSIDVVDGDGARQIIRLKDPLMLPSA